ncbi:LANO_0F07558g1_1 [Lachancea nothofagi CBS 11611]|uniref:LANO_0F07558g1_1 n=1 Tax=Lachancea nothofagi CBS 11611 TaxID=1266666 RepID=A0A1G4K8Y2_9SACH|nr:LANO_0F07558g1_1 [Lachancea nothofagi CBS 11611]
MLRLTTRRLYSSRNLFKTFPQTLVGAKWAWNVDLRSLRKEYRGLQAQEHPDTNANTDSSRSSELNHAYQTLRQPLLRAQHILKTQAGMDLNDEHVAQRIAQQDPVLLMRVLDVHEELENLASEDDVKKVSLENQERLRDLEQRLGQAFSCQNWGLAAQLTVELKYWTSLDRAIKEWEPGKRLELNH